MLILWFVAVNGRGVDMLKAGTKRRRTKAEIEAFKLEEQKKEERARHARRRIDQLEGHVTAARQTAEEHAASTQILMGFS